MGWCHVGFVLVNADRFDAACRVYDTALADARDRGSVFAFALACLLRGGVAYLRGSLADAEADLRLAIEACESNRLAAGLPTPFGYLADTLMERGELVAAADVLARVASEAGLPDTVHLVSFRASRARLWILQGRTREGLAELLALGRRYEAIGGRNPAFFSWRSQAALALLELGEREEARRLAAEEVEQARQWGAPRALGHAPSSSPASTHSPRASVGSRPWRPTACPTARSPRRCSSPREQSRSISRTPTASSGSAPAPSCHTRLRRRSWQAAKRSRRHSPPPDRGREHCCCARATAPKDYGFFKGALPMRTPCPSSETGPATTEERTTQRKETYATFGSDGGGACRCGGARGGVCLVGGCLRRRCQPRYVADRHFRQLQQPGLVVLPKPGDGQPRAWRLLGLGRVRPLRRWDDHGRCADDGLRTRDRRCRLLWRGACGRGHHERPSRAGGAGRSELWDAGRPGLLHRQQRGKRRAQRS